ncbi:hypothetical protein [Streptosporangium sp. G12]
MARWRKNSWEPRPGGFHITRLDQESAPAAPQPEGALAPQDVFASRFTVPADALTFLAAIRDDDRRRYPPTRRGPDGAVWVIVSQSRPSEAELSWALGGTVHLPAGPNLVSPRGRVQAWADVDAWPRVSWLELAAGFAPGDGGGEQRELLVVTTGPIARWLIDRFHAGDLDVRVALAHLNGPEHWPAVLVRVTGRGRTVPKSVAYALAGLPQTVVCRTGTDRLLVDHRLSLPLPDEELARWVPVGEQWLLTAELGLWQIVERGNEQTPPLRAADALRPPPAPPAGRFPPDLGVEVRLVPDEQARTIDALLLSDDELPPVRRFLTGHPTGERAFLVLGAGWHLLAEPGRDLPDVPFGIPLHRVGPGALYLQSGYRLQPGLPAAARAALFALNSESLVVVRAGETHRLSTGHTVPIWSLWLGRTVAADAQAGSLSPTAQAILERVDAADARVTEVAVEADPADAVRTGLRSEGFLLEQQGKLSEAARKYWEAGEPLLAARLYELAAGTDQ